MDKKDALIGILGTILIVTAVLLFMSVRIHNVGRIRAIGIRFYWDKECINRCTKIDWGIIDAGSNKSVILYAKNTQTVNLTLTIITENWEPINASDYITAHWNYTGEIILIERTVPIKFTLSVSPDIEGIKAFSFDYLIRALEATYP